MSIFDAFRKRKPSFDTQLFGKWRLQHSEQDLSSADDTVADFSSDGALTYSITQEGKTGIMKMTYRTEGGFIIFDQPSSPGEERTAYRIEPDGCLVLIYDGQPSRFSRVQ